MTRRALQAVAAALALAVGCTEATTELLPRGKAPEPPAPVADSGLGGSSAPEPADGAVSEPMQCGRHACACDDGVDQDGDMLIDGLDPECTSPFDNDEASFGTGPGGVVLPACQGCFWHGGMGMSQEKCSRPLDCVFGSEPSPTLADSCGECTASESCAQSCLPSTPNGCDCFGCCEAITATGPVHILLAGTCSLRDVDDVEKCPRCTPSAECLNPCGTCELCGSKKRKDLPSQCRGMPMQPLNTCDGGEMVCDETTLCPEPYYCQLGCCRIVVL